MKLVAAAKLRRAQERIIAARPYAGKMREVLASLASRAEPGRHPILARRPEKKVIVLVLSADKGMCGSFNTNILNRTRAFLDGLSDRDVKVDVVGRKARDWFNRRHYAVRRIVIDIFRTLSLQHAQGIATDLVRAFVEEECDAVYMIYNEFKSAIQQRVVVEPLLPIPRETFAAEEKKVETLPGGEEDYIYEPAQEELFASLLPKHVDVQVYRALLESFAAENGARMAAMDNATRNAEEMIESLTLQMNKIRQASITKEILEVVSGADALK